MISKIFFKGNTLSFLHLECGCMTSILAAILDNEDEGYRPEMVEGE
jgi:hypothetical protein